MPTILSTNKLVQSSSSIAMSVTSFSTTSKMTTDGEDDDEQDVCDWPPKSETCQALRDMWYYDNQSRQCRTFKYGRCDGNPNRFLTLDECEQLCHHKFSTTHDSDVCDLPMVVGSCIASIESWYYEPALGTCTKFYYGGCDGNGNRFETLEQCKARCEKPSTEVVAVDMCKLPKNSGPCDELVLKWYFNPADGTCGRFYYGGCHGNANRFTTFEECEMKCASKLDPCTLSPVQGPCNSRHTRWYREQKSKSCKQFIYSGCLGNSNNFGSASECESKCSQQRGQSRRTQSLTGRTAVLSDSVTDVISNGYVCPMLVAPGRRETSLEILLQCAESFRLQRIRKSFRTN